jgi:hypothetical protein
LGNLISGSLYIVKNFIETTKALRNGQVGFGKDNKKPFFFTKIGT